ncbi:MAG: hypothetical protein P8177_03530, partial [Gemmatimonadota bacterium]
MPGTERLRVRRGNVRPLLFAAAALAAAGCSDVTSPGAEAPAPIVYELEPVQALYSLNPGAVTSLSEMDQ